MYYKGSTKIDLIDKMYYRNSNKNTDLLLWLCRLTLKFKLQILV